MTRKFFGTDGIRGRTNQHPMTAQMAQRVGQDFGLAASWAGIRTLRLADGPDEVHLRAIARLEFAKHAE